MSDTAQTPGTPGADQATYSAALATEFRRPGSREEWENLGRLLLEPAEPDRER